MSTTKLDILARLTLAPLLLFALTPISSPTALAQAVADTAFDVAGVKLGMTPDEAIDALKQFDSWPILDKRFYSGAAGYGELGHTEACASPAQKTMQLLVSIVAAKGPRSTQIMPTFGGRGFGSTTPGCEWTGGMKPVRPEDEPMDVAVYLSPVPGKERVIAVSLWKSFKNPVAVDAVLSSAQKKFQGDITAKIHRFNAEIVCWRYDVRGRILSEEPARRAGLLNSPAGTGQVPALPGTVRQGDGLAVDLYVATDPSNPLVARAYSTSIYTGRGLFDFVEQARSTYAAMKDNEKKEELEKAKKSDSSIKF